MENVDFQDKWLKKINDLTEYVKATSEHCIMLGNKVFDLESEIENLNKEILNLSRGSQ